ncbi:MAG: ABC transporter ATP-binding protein [Proteobacteria bacterium]|nr:ABC transporter ATP-binding protein [Pseudomonadota bacterium]MBU4275502.1 ABC transporter ATP-binding protein [Pseudomonadota bacterium]MBU4382779.1 ABC transporter ATP-binding protein [Pseudomonadota bacterium]MBU4605338.1 ABC transporter ATP-binding protein [Pseudomonadota bacterium]MCG2765294.1 ABC transporter ATP-binding protein [Desulfarculaceae bacterium]
MDDLLVVKDLTKNFGGLAAVSEVSFEVRRGEILGLIGPNGAGKTTLFNLISGLLASDRGSIKLEGEDLTKKPPYKRSAMGVGRTFQVVRPFDMTVLENVMVPTFAHYKTSKEAKEKAFEILKMVRMDKLADKMPANLTLAQRKRIEVARALATKPKLLLLDEVLAGLNPTEVAENLPLIRQVRDSGVTILFIEHLMDAMMAISERVLVMDQGVLIACGTPDEVTSDRCVITAYLGEEAPGC